MSMDVNIARIIQKSNLSREKTALPDLSAFSFQTEMIIEMFPGPALMVDSEQNILHHNIHALGIVEALQAGDLTFTGLIARSLTNNCPDMQKVILNDSKGIRHYNLYAMPASRQDATGEKAVLVTGREITVEHNLTNALVESRQMFKDLVSCSSDFSWETDSQGRFKYVSPKGILGYTAYELNGKLAADLIVGNEGKNPFDTLDTIHDMELWVQRNDGTKACILVSAVPIIDNKSSWQGARGVCRDITVVREREAALRRIGKREHILNRIVTTIRDLSKPDEIFSNLLNATLEGIRAKHACILEIKKSRNGSLDAETRACSGTLDDHDLLHKLTQKAVEVCRNNAPGESRLAGTFTQDGWSVLFSITQHHNEPNGAFCLLREEGSQEWSEEDAILFNGISSHLGIAMEQIHKQEELEHLSRTDELTGLLNRRAFTEEVKKRITHQKRSRENCALLFVDLDNFKTVNDKLGHKVGDKVLQKVAELLSKNTRVGDYICRLGGDEFALWLENVDADVAMEKASDLVAGRRSLQQVTGELSPAPGLSIGVAISSPRKNVTLDQLLELADAALYDVKKTGKNAVTLAEGDRSGEGRERNEKSAE
ncbi:sensor domain-containing diguanylate cyclase [Emcibacter nanhaiensis]|uniref:Diguanylate cyclase n=1 Tax=Emcibacter nanhaiensis TaxID=1505037 RepID=A0A501PBQ6_9PROT|nr:diguanylate cyclase [Emcibacter nanhaiensis]TPD57839.1 diguanylate cyclase [Emcibacter nanhaiensis]